MTITVSVESLRIELNPLGHLVTDSTSVRKNTERSHGKLFWRCSSSYNISVRWVYRQTFPYHLKIQLCSGLTIKSSFILQAWELFKGTQERASALAFAFALWLTICRINRNTQHLQIFFVAQNSTQWTKRRSNQGGLSVMADIISMRMRTHLAQNGRSMKTRMGLLDCMIWM